MSKQSDLLNLTDAISVSGTNVGIGGAPDLWDTFNAAQANNISLAGYSTTQGGIIQNAYYAGGWKYSSTNPASMYYQDSGTHQFHTAASGTAGTALTWSQKMTIDSSGNVLVGTTNVNIRDSSSEEGMVYRNGDSLDINRSAAPPLIVNRVGNSDGDLVLLRKDGVTVGSIGAFSGYVYIANNNGDGMALQNNSFRPATNTGANQDNVIDLGLIGSRFDDIYATNGTINTSDRNEKQDIDVMSEAETRVAVACKGLMRKFRWIDAVVEKGDDARIHFGIIAQDLQDAFAAEGLDAGRYAMFISSTWWETQTDVPAVEAVAEVLDEEGNVVTEAVEAKEAYTRTDTYQTLEEAPEGATERTRLGVRYSELLAFIIGAL
jgi:hypothetical protein